MVGLGDPDDAAVWWLDEQRALVATMDFFTPVVDDPYNYGAIAAANSLSDVYAMGGQPFLALNIAALPPNLPSELIAEILRGGAETLRQAGVVLAGGHTVQDKEPKFGFVVLGFVHPDQMLTKARAQPGDVLVLSKPLGTGTITTALKNGLADPADVAEAVDWMKRLNRFAGELAVQFGALSGTDITGFSLLGHGLEMAKASGVGFRIFYNQIPFLSGAQRYASEWIFPGGTSDNRLFYGTQVSFAPEIDEASQMLLFDAQTSGGLLLAVPEARAAELLEAGKRLDQPLWPIGQVIAGQGIAVSP
ncbi:MAG: selenide, water dikinase SelD [Anaerolineales bacterium]|nr:selenide, water dikinase SelD [Anaerolineales bacterium]